MMLLQYDGDRHGDGARHVDNSIQNVVHKSSFLPG
jgi:hypothetical protein